MKNDLGEKPMTTFVGLRAKTCSYLKNVVSEDKKQKTKKVDHQKKIPKFQNYKLFRRNSN